MKPTAKIVPATKEYISALYPEGIHKTFYGWVALLDDKPVGCNGIYKESGKYIVFARIKDELRPYKLTIYKASRKLLEMMEDVGEPIYSIADPSIKGSDTLLLDMGFEYIGRDWYVWTP